MPFYSMQVSIGRVTNVPADESVNNWSCFAQDTGGLALFAQEVIDFYTASSLSFSNLVRQNGHTFKCYDRDDPEPRIPVLTGTFNLTAAPSAAPLPPEVALVISFQGDPASGSPQARRRGRIYFGPMGAAANGADGRPTAGAIGVLRTNINALLTASNAATNWTWTVHSRVDGIDTPISNGWINNEWDTQRSRQIAATTRNVFP